jgi:hypothetical protein
MICLRSTTTTVQTNNYTSKTMFGIATDKGSLKASRSDKGKLPMIACKMKLSPRKIKLSRTSFPKIMSESKSSRSNPAPPRTYRYKVGLSYVYLLVGF